jgi:hypothetical protein
MFFLVQILYFDYVKVPVKYLKTYLLEMKYNGYILVGLEQTANSIQMNEFKFPENSVLILG